MGRQGSRPVTKWSAFEGCGAWGLGRTTGRHSAPAKRHAKCGKRTLQDASADVTLPACWQPVRMAGRSCLFICQPALLLRKYLIVACSCSRSCVCSVSTHQRCCSSASALASGQVLILILIASLVDLVLILILILNPEACHRGAVPC